MRHLSLHASALNDAEYDLLSTSLTDLDDSEQSTTGTHDDAYYERMKIGVREARGWLRGRYSHVSPANIDAVCLSLRASLMTDSFPFLTCDLTLDSSVFLPWFEPVGYTLWRTVFCGVAAGRAC